jgi:membrane protein DedA with SNARE-associated domain
MPGLAGMSQLHYRRFLIANALGGLVWGTGFTLIGYLAGSQLGLIEKFASYFSSGLLALFVLALVVAIVIRRRR